MLELSGGLEEASPTPGALIYIDVCLLNTFRIIEHIARIP